MPDAGGTHPTRVLDARTTEVAGFPIRRALPRAGMRAVGAWCFVDHMGPEIITETTGLDVGPHPHIGLHTVTWLLEGGVRHSDSLGSDQLIRPGQLNLMTAGRGIVHAEESVRAPGTLHGVQLWIAQPERTRHGAASFTHLPDLPSVDVGHGLATVMVGDFHDGLSPAAVDTALVGVDFDLRAGSSTHPLRSDFEYAVYVVRGSAQINSVTVAEGQLLDLREHGGELRLDAADPARLLLLGGEPLGESLSMWWNFVARDKDEIAAAAQDWADYVEVAAGNARFDRLPSTLAPIPAPALP